MTENVPPLSQVPGYRPAPGPFEDPLPPASAHPGELMVAGESRWTGPRTVLASAIVAALVALLVTLLLR